MLSRLRRFLQTHRKNTYAARRKDVELIPTKSDKRDIIRSSVSQISEHSESAGGYAVDWDSLLESHGYRRSNCFKRWD